MEAIRKYNEGIPQGSRLSLPSYQWLRERMEREGWDERIRKVKRIAVLAKEMGATTAQLAIAWCLVNPRVSTVITGATNPAQVVENMKSLDMTDKLSPDVMERIERILENKPQPDIDWREF